jgi:MFS family permease
VTSAPDLAPQQRATYREVLANRRFRLLFVTRTLTVTADSLRIMTLSVLVFATTGSPLLSALTFGVGFLPQLAGLLYLGSLADRARPRRLVTAGYGLQCAAAAVMRVAHLPVDAVLVLIAAVASRSRAAGSAASMGTWIARPLLPVDTPVGQRADPPIRQFLSN